PAAPVPRHQARPSAVASPGTGSGRHERGPLLLARRPGVLAAAIFPALVGPDHTCRRRRPVAGVFPAPGASAAAIARARTCTEGGTGPCMRPPRKTGNPFTRT